MIIVVASIVNFIIMDGTATGNVVPLNDITKKASAIDAAAADILASFWTDTQYRRGMTQQQLDAIWQLELGEVNRILGDLGLPTIDPECDQAAGCMVM